VIGVDEKGALDWEALEKALDDGASFVSCMQVNNETGALLDAARLHRMVNGRALIHVDGVQGYLRVPFDMKYADLYTLSSHKIHGPKGVGALYISPRLKSFPPLLYGGGQESNFRSGTEATPAIFGFAAACEAGTATFREDISREKALIDGLVEKLSAVRGVVINGSHEAPHILSLSIPGVPTQNTINILQDAGICVSAGSACAKGHRSHTLTAMKLSPEVMDGSFRVSLCKDSTQEELDKLVSVIENDIVGRYIP
jgi:cysteine desulfurase